MSAIEKICEFSGDYHGSKMYKWKQNHIQICPKYRDYFRGKDHVLYVGSGKAEWNWSTYKGDPFTLRKQEFNYCLYVPDLPGRVKGMYHNWTRNPQQMLFNMWELTGRKELNMHFFDKHDVYKELNRIAPNLSDVMLSYDRHIIDTKLSKNIYV
jgi:hypothetical protein